MSGSIWGVVKNGVIVPSTTLADGTRVEILPQTYPDLSPEYRARFATWDIASAVALELVDEDGSPESPG